ncbi:hypothetical protein SISSUDRAFT_1068603 [Sistotremastrum suecicum HHB10207 ss-3]|uniref:Peptidase S9 prolyl oligopeptidase catalytic domain-containing protein n=1 Tax=Sistotremastrum suecicum HHB10207 ss-3 TaxID=1314776 RepID=A0A166IXT4_9AGAM|nr:hypothetical protein SISSUDRAFT_1068603 [Sistotremastrum suecicum HHB10207 ss-3]
MRVAIGFLLAFLRHLHGSDASGNQIVLGETRYGWSATLDPVLDVLGPFPIAAREQHIIGPGYPLNLYAPYIHDSNRTYPSAYADGGRVAWSKAIIEENGDINIRYEDIRWETLRATEGWAAFQHHSVLRARLSLSPPTGGLRVSAPNLKVDLSQGSYFAILPSNSDGFEHEGVPEWHSGNIYATEMVPSNTIRFSALPWNETSVFDVFISGDYEIRLFGDPATTCDAVPTLALNFKLVLEHAPANVVRDISQDVVPDIVDHYFFGSSIGIGIRSTEGWWVLRSTSLQPLERDRAEILKGLRLCLTRDTHIAPSQTRILNFEIFQSRPLKASRLQFRLEFVALASDVDDTIYLDITLDLRHRTITGDDANFPLIATHFDNVPLPYLAIPPRVTSASPPILFLHGAGVDIIQDLTWGRALPRQSYSWIIMPTGRGPWGFDWRGPSSTEVWHALDSLVAILSSRVEWEKWIIPKDSRAVVAGHSNGGQGTWYAITHNPDRVLAAIPAAGYIKAQLIHHFIDPSLRGILDSSSTYDDNDLYLSNVADMKILAIHGGADSNVPTWHSRAMLGVVESWCADAPIAFYEQPGMPHWYSSVFDSDRVRDFLESVLSPDLTKPPSESFTLTTISTSENISLHGCRIEGTLVHGRLAQLSVTLVSGSLLISTSNVERFSIPIAFLSNVSSLQINGKLLDVLEQAALTEPYRAAGRIAQILETDQVIFLVYADDSPRALSAALRLAHSLAVYLKIDSELVSDSEAVHGEATGRLGSGNLICISIALLGPFCQKQLEHAQGKEPNVAISATSIKVHGVSFTRNGTGRPRFLIPAIAVHQSFSAGALLLGPRWGSEADRVLFLWGIDVKGLEGALLLFPFRTGIPGPEWLIVDDRLGRVAAAGFVSLLLHV